MFEQKKLGIIYLSHDRFDFYIPQQANVISYYFPKEIVSDLEVKNKGELTIQIQGFIHKNKLTHANLIIILSDHVCFLKDVSKGPDVHYEAEMNKFLEQIPFERISSKLFFLEKNARLTAVNQDFYESIKSSFEKEGLYTIMVIPAFTVNNPAHFVRGLDRETAQSVIEKMESFRTHNMLVSTIIEEKKETKEIKQESSDSKQMYILLGILGFLMVVLVVMIILIRPFG